MFSNNKLTGIIDPRGGGHLYELDVRKICHNLLATLTRKEEAYHEKVRGDASDDGENGGNIHGDRVVFKQEGLNERIQYDRTSRNSLVDHFYPHDVSIEQVARNEFHELGDFASGDFEAKIRRDKDRVQVQLFRHGRVGDH